MTATSYAMIVSLTVIFFSFGIITFNEMNLYMLTETGGPGVGRPLATYNTTAFIGYEDLEGLQTQTKLNSTLGEIGNFQKPDNVDFNFDFWKSISIYRILINMLWTPIYGFVDFLVTAFYMPIWLAGPMFIMINLSNILFGIYVFLGKEF